MPRIGRRAWPIANARARSPSRPWCGQRGFELALELVVHHDLEPELGDALADERLGRRHELDRLLQEALIPDEQLLLDDAVGVVTRVDLVGCERDQVGRGRLLVGVDDDPAAEIAEVVVERPPGLVVHLLDDELLARGQLDERSHPGAQHRDERTERGNHPRRLDRMLAPVGLVALVERSIAREQILERFVRRAVGRLGAELRPDAVALLDLVGVRESSRPRARGRRCRDRGSDP